jgi:hypothetical protein
MGSTISTEYAHKSVNESPVQKPSVPSRDTDGYRTLVKKLRQIQLEEQYVIVE